MKPPRVFLIVWALVAVAASFLLTGTSRAASTAGHSLALVAGVWAIVLPLGVFLAVVAWRFDVVDAAFWGVCLVLPALVPLPVLAGLWTAVLGVQGLIPMLLGTTAPTGLLPAILTHALAALPWVVALVGLSLRSVERELEEDALLVASPARVVMSVTLPRAAGSVGTAAVLVAALALGEITATDLFQVPTLAEEVYLSFSAWGEVDPLTMLRQPGMLAVMALSGIATAAFFRSSPRRWQAVWREGHVFRLGKARTWMTCSVALLALAPLGGLLSVLVLRAGIVSQPITAAMTSDEPGVETADSNPRYVRFWSLRTAGRTLGQAVVRRWREWLATLASAALASAAAVAIALPLAWWGLERPRAAALLGFAAGALLALPGPVLAVLLIHLFNREGVFGAIYESPLLLVIGWALRVWPFVMLAIWAPLRTIPPAVLEMARVDGATPWQLARRVQWPLSRIPTLAAGLVGLALSIGDLSVSVLLQQPDFTPLSVQVFADLHAGLYNEVAGISLVLVALTMGTGGAIVVLLRRWGEMLQTA